ncbi:MAG: hypothetical protein JO316_13455 [Abitibacteriaceae bacterium]|nr:hypothetical protein [Abditibacteriaceae bacterium]
MNQPKSNVPWWETAVLIGSFILLWVWFLARQAAYKSPTGQLSILWQIPLIISLVALVIVTVRRVKRVQRALRGEDEDGNPLPTAFPRFGGPPHR